MRNKVFAELDPTKFSPSDLDMPEYPGTVLGDRPEDDPHFYEIWLGENQSPMMKRISELFGKLSQKDYKIDVDEDKVIKVENPDDFKTIQNINFTDYATGDLTETEYMDNDETKY